jgi:hypothetical protein
MMEQPVVSAEAEVPSLLAGRALSDEVRASLEAVRVAQTAARLRARQQTVRTRVWLAALVGAAALVMFAVGPRVARRSHARAQAAPPARPAEATMLANAPDIPAPKLAPPDMSATKPSHPAAPPAPVPPPETRAVAAPGGACDTGLIQKAPWLLSPEACAPVFDADPSSAALALAIAHAEHARGHLADAAQWAKRALSLDPNAAEAYVLIARADTERGRHEDARAAYRRYLDLAPRGWHQAEARTGVRRARPTAAVDSARAR